MSTPVSKGFFLFLPGGQSPIARPEPRRFRRLLHLGNPRRFLGTRFPGTSAGYLLRLSQLKFLLESYKACHPIQAEHAWKLPEHQLFSNLSLPISVCTALRVKLSPVTRSRPNTLGTVEPRSLGLGFSLPFSNCATQGARNPRMSVLANEDQTSWG